MVKGLANWEPLGSQINRRYVEQVLGLLEQQQQQQPAGQQQQSQQQSMDADTDMQAAQQQPGMERSEQQGSSRRPAAAADQQQHTPLPHSSQPPGSVVPLESAITASQKLLNFLVHHLAPSCAAAAGFKAHCAALSGERLPWSEQARHVAQLLQVGADRRQLIGQLLGKSCMHAGKCRMSAT